MSAPGYPGSPHQAPYPMPPSGGYSMVPYPTPQAGYGDPTQQPPPMGFNMGYQPQPGPQQPVMYQPGPVGVGAPAAVSPVPVSVPVGIPPGLEYLAQIDQILIHQKVELLEGKLDHSGASQ
ncbi:phospholipid scramblase 1-like [Aplochiton taeniatus]